MQTWALIKDSFREAIDRKLFWVMLGISLFVALVMVCVGFDEKGISFLFGMWRWESSELAMGSSLRTSTLAGILAHGLADFYLGWVGLVLALIATAGVFPSFMEKGTVEILLSKPMRRWRLFLGKYAGSMVFILMQSVAFIGLTFLVAGVRWNLWLWSYLWFIPLFVILFSYLYCFAVLFGILTRSALTSVLLTLVVWCLIWVPQVAYESFQQMAERQGPGSWYAAISITRDVLPKTRDISYIAGKLIGADTPSQHVSFEGTDLSEAERSVVEDVRRGEKAMADVNIARSISSSLAFEAVIVVMAGWRFCRRDF